MAASGGANGTLRQELRREVKLLFAEEATGLLFFCWATYVSRKFGITQMFFCCCYTTLKVCFSARLMQLSWGNVNSVYPSLCPPSLPHFWIKQEALSRIMPGNHTGIATWNHAKWTAASGQGVCYTARAANDLGLQVTHHQCLSKAWCSLLSEVVSWGGECVLKMCWYFLWHCVGVCRRWSIQLIMVHIRLW